MVAKFTLGHRLKELKMCHRLSVDTDQNIQNRLVYKPTRVLRLSGLANYNIEHRDFTDLRARIGVRKHWLSLSLAYETLRKDNISIFDGEVDVVVPSKQASFHLQSIIRLPSKASLGFHYAICSQTRGLVLQVQQRTKDHLLKAKINNNGRLDLAAKKKVNKWWIGASMGMDAAKLTQKQGIDFGVAIEGTI